MTSANTQEIEFKWGMPSRQAFDRFLRAVAGEHRDGVQQTNHFFDTSELLLNQAHHSFRLRVSGGRYLVTLKGPSTSSGELTVRSEIEWNVPEALGLSVLRDEAAPLQLIDAAREALTQHESGLVERLLSPATGRDLLHVGHFENCRTLVETELQHHGQLLTVAFELDETSFGGAEPEFEVELEVTAEQAEVYGEAVKRLLEELAIVPIERRSKSQRFFERLRAARGIA